MCQSTRTPSAAGARGEGGRRPARWAVLHGPARAVGSGWSTRACSPPQGGRDHHLRLARRQQASLTVPRMCADDLRVDPSIRHERKMKRATPSARASALRVDPADARGDKALLPTGEGSNAYLNGQHGRAPYLRVTVRHETLARARNVGQASDRVRGHARAVGRYRQRRRASTGRYDGTSFSRVLVGVL